jgi:hypothetical protein
MYAELLAKKKLNDQTILSDSNKHSERSDATVSTLNLQEKQSE